MDRKAAVLEQLNIAGLINSLFTRCTPAGANQVLVCCPVHADKHASCSINTESGLWNCKACGASGNIFDLFMAVRGLDFSSALRELESHCGISPSQTEQPRPKQSPAKHKPKKKRKSQPQGQTVATYRYFDAEGECRYLKRRIEPGRDGRKKEFAFAHFLADGNTAPGRGAWPPFLYGLHRLATAAPSERIFIVEGEGKVDALTAWGLIAVCTDSGAAGRWPENFNHLFTSREIIILPDNDPPGEKYAAKVAAALTPVASLIKVLRLPNLPEKGDVIDWIASKTKGGY